MTLVNGVMLPIIILQIMMTNINTQIDKIGGKKQVMVYPTKYEINTGKQETVESIIEGIQTQAARKTIEKEQLPVAFFSVVGFSGNKSSKNVIEHSGLIVIDLDVKDNPDTDFNLLFNTLQWNGLVLACFRSPSNGIKIIFTTDIKEVMHHEAYYKAISEYLLNRYEEICKIDTSGSNINRACYLPYDPTVFLNPVPEIFRVSKDYIDSYFKAHPIKSGNGSSPKPLLQVKYLSYHEHYLNIINVVSKWTSMGIEMFEKGTSVGEKINEESIHSENEIGTSVGTGGNELGTSVGIYDCIFNKFRFHTIKDSVMSTNVPFFEILFMKYCTPSKVERETRLDEIYFKDYPDKRLSTDDFVGIDGLEVCEIKTIDVIKEGKRGKTLTSMCTKLIFNNPFCHPALIARELQSINYHYCEDTNPKNPSPDDAEINAIVSSCYQKFIDGELDFTEVMRKKKNYKDISKRRVFCSRFHDKMNASEKQKQCIKTYSESRRNKNIRHYEEAVTALQDGKKITIKRIAEYMGKSRKQVSRYRTNIQLKEHLSRIQTTINEYNATLRK